MARAHRLSITFNHMGNTAALHNQGADRGEPSIEAQEFSFYYSDFCALDRITLRAERGGITALIGPSGCGKSTLLRAINRMHDTTPGVRASGWLAIGGQEIYHPTVDPVLLRRRVSMIFPRPNPFNKSIYENVAYGLRLQGTGSRAELSALVEAALRRAALWDEVKDRLDLPGTALSPGQQQRLCIARAIAPQPEVLLMDEPCSLLDQIATLKIEQLISELRSQHSIIIATHNLQQAARISDQTAFMLMESGTRAGQLIECAPTAQIFTTPKDMRTEAYISGRY